MTTNFSFRHALTPALNLVLNVTDVFNANKIETITDNDLLHETSIRRYDGRLVYLGLSYRFGGAAGARPGAVAAGAVRIRAATTLRAAAELSPADRADLSGPTYPHGKVHRRPQPIFRINELNISARKAHNRYILHIVRRCILRRLFTMNKTVRRAAAVESKTEASTISLELLLGNLPGAVYRCLNDERWTMEFVSAGIEKLTGYPPSAFTARSAFTFASIIRPSDRQEVAHQIEAALASQRPFQVTYRIITASGATKWVWEQGAAVLDATGESSPSKVLSPISPASRNPTQWWWNRRRCSTRRAMLFT